MNRTHTFAVATIAVLVALPPLAVHSQLAGPKPAAGRILVAHPRLADPNFRHSVVLLITYNQDGAMGIVLNRPTQVPLESVLPDVRELKGAGHRLFAGGPVAINRMLMLLRTGKPPPGSLRVLDDLYVGGERKSLGPLARVKGAARRFRVLAGHAGWAAGQLDAEIARSDWYVIRADASIILDTPPDQMWQRLIDRLSGDWASALSTSQPGTICSRSFGDVRTKQLWGDRLPASAGRLPSQPAKGFGRQRPAAQPNRHRLVA
jgi:putative transcriptional regulator